MLIANGGQAITNVYALLPLQALASVAVMVKLNVPDCDGAPLKAPPGASVMPVGNAPPVTANV